MEPGAGPAELHEDLLAAQGAPDLRHQEGVARVLPGGPLAAPVPGHRRLHVGLPLLRAGGAGADPAGPHGDPGTSPRVRAT